MNKGPREFTTPPGDDRKRLTCPDCNYVVYENPKIVAGSVVEHEGKILLCKRNIEPRKGLWTLPAGYMELDETTEEAAAREAWEEAEAEIEITGLVGVFNLPHLNQVQLIYKAVLTDERIKAGPESQEVKLFAWNEIPWKDLAFPTVEMALHYWNNVKEKEDGKFSPLRAISNANVEGL